MGRVLDLMERPDEAVAAYERGIRADLSSDVVRMDLADHYMTRGEYVKAEEHLVKVVRTNPTATGPIASLGHVYLTQGRLAEADTQFKKLLTLAPRDAATRYSMGALRAAQGESSEAINYFKQAIELRKDYAAAHSDLAYAYLDAGDMDKAKEQVDALYNINTEESLALAYDVEIEMFTPKISYIDYSRSSFNTLLGPGTELQNLDSSLATPGASHTFSVSFQFNQPMDIASIQDIFNWKISKADGGEAGVYNHGANLHPQNEVSILPYPVSVVYDKASDRATLYFKVTQNAAGTGVMDPSHWVFKFSGVDATGHAMDPTADQYSKSAGHPF